MAELLVRAQGHWLDALTTEQVAALPDWRQTEHKYRAKKGDIVVIRPDGWTWGREECLPRFIVVKIPGLSVEDAKKYEELLEIKAATATERAQFRGKKYALPLQFIEAAITQKKSVHSLNKASLLSTVLTKTK